MSLDIHFRRLPKGVEYRSVGTIERYEYACPYAEWEGNWDQATRVEEHEYALFIDGEMVDAPNLMKYPDGTYSFSARGGAAAASIVHERCKKQRIKCDIW